jgi:ABC-type lipoprotein release transport system permease subunit
MRSLLTLAWRNLWRNRRRTFINLSAAGFGLFLLILYQGLIDSIMSDAKSQMSTTGMGHVEITAPGWRVKRSVGLAMESPQALLSRLELPPGSQAGARLSARGLASSAHGSQGVEVRGIDPVNEAKLAVYVSDLRDGAALSAEDAHGVLIGEKLAERLKVRVGQKLRLMVQRADGEMGADIFRVRGIFHSIAVPISRGQVLVSAGAARALFGLGDVAHQVVIQLERADDADGLAASLRGRLGPGYEVASYGDILPVLRAMEGLMAGMMLVMGGFVYLLVGLGIMNTMLMSVLERTREFGVMQALGNRPRQVVWLVLAEAFWVATLSVAIGLSLGLLATWFGAHYSVFDMGKSVGESMEIGGTVLKSSFHTRFSPLAALKAAAIVQVLTVLVGLYPAWRVSKMNPADALRAV